MNLYARKKMGRSFIFQHDNDSRHINKKVKQWLEAWRINALKWPAQSLDLNPIEHLWNDVDRVVKRLKPQNIELEAIIKETWSAIPVERCMKLVDSNRNRCLAVIECKGYPT
ncbi:hypothetical protein Q1695_015347 [Nippostrongylus brasiliensis]|nr:hypothetical protein Q1695_015347 [Nippostrongylus brasiliensis]